MKYVHVNLEGPCAKIFDCCSGINKGSKLNWVGNDDLYVDGEAVFIKVKIAKSVVADKSWQYQSLIKQGKEYYMNCITGTLFNKDGSCVSSLIMPTKHFIKDTQKGLKILFDKKLLT